MPGAEPFSAQGSEHGVLVLHGFTGNPQSMRGIATALAAAGFTVELPLLPGHGTDVADMVPTRWEDWSGAAEAAYQALAERCATVGVVGLSMGGGLTCWLAERHLEIGAIALVNPLVLAPPAELTGIIDDLLASGLELAPGVGSDIAKPGVEEMAYAESPLRAALSLFEGAGLVGDKLGDISCPVLLFSSTDDHVVDPTSGDKVANTVSGPIERIMLEKSFHVATLDYDADLIEAKTVEFFSAIWPKSL
jgi:carboxylesterase